MLTLIERTREEKIIALQAIEEHLRIQLMNIRAEIRELQLEPAKQPPPAPTPVAPPKPAIPDESTSNDINVNVVWETPVSGYTLDNNGIKRTFTVQRWDDMRPNAVIELTTTDGKVISSAWQTVAIRKNSHFNAIRASYMPHFYSMVSQEGYHLQETLKLGCDAAFRVFKDGTELGVIGFDKFQWFIGNRSVYSWKKYWSISEVLSALETEATAKIEIGL